jgi:hypothetical protein
MGDYRPSKPPPKAFVKQQKLKAAVNLAVAQATYGASAPMVAQSQVDDSMETVIKRAHEALNKFALSNPTHFESKSGSKPKEKPVRVPPSVKRPADTVRPDQDEHDRRIQAEIEKDWNSWGHRAKPVPSAILNGSHSTSRSSNDSSKRPRLCVVCLVIVCTFLLVASVTNMGQLSNWLSTQSTVWFGRRIVHELISFRINRKIVVEAVVTICAVYLREALLFFCSILIGLLPTLSGVKLEFAFPAREGYVKYNGSEWTVDSGATSHVCRQRELFSTLTPCKQPVLTIADGTQLAIIGVGTVGQLTNVLYVPEVTTNLLSVTAIVDSQRGECHPGTNRRPGRRVSRRDLGHQLAPRVLERVFAHGA